MRNGLVFLGSTNMATTIDTRETKTKSEEKPSTPSTTPKKDARLKAGVPDLQKPGKFQVIRGHGHHRHLPPVMEADGKTVKTPSTEVIVPVGHTFECEGDEAEACRKDGGNKFKEV